MIVAVSRFRVLNGLEAEVRRAFRDRPRLVEAAPGFIGLEVLSDLRDPSFFVLVTRWVDEGAFRTWHASAAHRRSHAGIPAGLKLDPAHTQLRVLGRVPTSPAADEEAAVREAAEVLAGSLPSSDVLAVVSTTGDGAITWSNRGFQLTVGATDGEVAGKPLAAFLPEADAVRLAELTARPETRRERLSLNFTGVTGEVVTLSCDFSVRPGGLLMIGEPALAEDRSLQRHLLALTNELSATLRENEGIRRELAAAKEELDRSYWHLRKIEEVLPICLECGKVKTSETRWEDVASYLRTHSLFLSHGYCPACAARLFDDRERS